ncbi:MAG: DUF6036 family nucleotidyltransferase [Nitriliruptor sp.]|uniref:DUF6036 family nucleotidyltransferase n=1 Tax=Nitriliruptor sp. TaxID=2448056 RepID=UPI0034A09177
MRREEVLHVARAAAQVAGVRRVLVIGSQAVVGAYHENDLPGAVLASIEVDIVVLDDPAGTAHHAVEGSLGYMSLFHTTHGYYAEGVEAGTAVLPSGWEGRVLTLTVADARGAEFSVHFPELHDLCISKLVAARTKDRAFVAALRTAGLLDGDVLVERARTIPGVPPSVVQRTVAAAQSVLASDADGPC